MEPLIIGGGSEQAGVLYLLGVLSIMLAGLVLIIRTRGLFVLLLLFGLVAVAIGSFSPGGRSDTEPIPISPVQQQPQRCACTDAAVQEQHASQARPEVAAPVAYLTMPGPLAPGNIPVPGGTDSSTQHITRDCALTGKVSGPSRSTDTPLKTPLPPAHRKRYRWKSAIAGASTLYLEALSVGFLALPRV